MLNSWSVPCECVYNSHAQKLCRSTPPSQPERRLETPRNAPLELSKVGGKVLRRWGARGGLAEVFGFGCADMAGVGVKKGTAVQNLVRAELDRKEKSLVEEEE